MSSEVKFGVQRLYRDDIGAGKRLVYKAMGIADPAHYLHSRYFIDALEASSPSGLKSILDAGCGRGDYSIYLAQRLPEANILAIDLDTSLIETNRKTAERLGLKNVRFETGDIAALSLEDKFDFVFSIDVLEHLDKQQQAMERLAASLRPGGFAFYHLPTVREKPVPFSNLLKDFHEWAEEEHIAEERTADEFVRLVADSGLQPVTTRRTFGRYSGELATSLFAIPFKDNLPSQIAQAVLAPLCRLISLLDEMEIETTRYAVAVHARKPPV